MFMKIFKVITFFTLLFVFAACDDRNKDADYLNGEIVYVNKDSVKVRDIAGKTTHIENCGYGMFSVYDSLMVFWNPRFNHHFFCMYNIDTEREIGYFCNIGKGHNEFLSVGSITQFFKVGDDLKTTICDFNNQKIFFWNISQSILKKTTVYDTIIPYNNLNLSKNTLVDNLFYQPDDTFLGKVQADDNYIYATYWGDKQWDTSLGTKCPFIHIIHVFNWAGEMLYEIKTDRVFF